MGHGVMFIFTVLESKEKAAQGRSTCREGSPPPLPRAFRYHAGYGPPLVTALVPLVITLFD